MMHAFSAIAGCVIAHAQPRCTGEAQFDFAR
jgi:hypothetical protein